MEPLCTATIQQKPNYSKTGVFKKLIGGDIVKEIHSKPEIEINVIEVEEVTVSAQGVDKAACPLCFE